jgi:hypothetical protein
MSEQPVLPDTDGLPEKPKLSEDDMARVAEYLNAPSRRRERAPFRPWTLMLVLMGIVVGLTLLSLLYARQHGITD